MKVIVIGGGASGMLCAALCGGEGLQVTLIEHSEKLGKKLYITGKGRCNFTNACTREEFLENVVTNPRFLQSASAALTPAALIELFESYGLESKVERGRRAFPVSDRSADVLDMLKRALKRARVRTLLNTHVSSLVIRDGAVRGVEAETEKGREVLEADAVVVATGGLSYPSTGSTGDGYRFAEAAGHTVTPLCPSLVPVSCAEEYVRAMQGLSLKNVALTVQSGKKILFREQGEMMFTHFGVTGPLVLSASAVCGLLIGKKPLSVSVDLKPAIDAETLDKRFVRLFSEHPNRALKNVIQELYPSKMAPLIPAIAGVPGEKPVREITRAERAALTETTKALPLTFTALRGYNEAVVTKGGVSVKEIDPKTMESKRVRGLYFTGEVLDVDAFTGGYNLQIAWCTAAACAAGLRSKAYTEETG